MTRQSNGVQFPAFPSREQICQGLLLAPSPAQDSRVNSEYPQLLLALLLQISPRVKVFFFFFGHVTDTSKKCATSKLPWPHSCIVYISQQVGQPTCLSVDEQTKCGIDTLRYSASKRTEILTYTTTRMNLEEGT